MKGCHFHYGQSIWKFVMDHGQKSSFSKYIEFATFIKCNIGLAFVPLDRLQEGLDVLYNLAIKLPKNFTRFLARFMIHFEKTWIEGNFPPQTWDYFLFHGSTTNNFNEGVNRELSGDVMETKPNPYKAVAKFKKIFVETADDAIAIIAGNFGKKKQKCELQFRRENR